MDSFCENFSSNMVDNTCENCRELSKKIDTLQESVDKLCKMVQQQNESIKAAFTPEIDVKPKQASQERSVVTADINYFPITNDKMLKDIDTQLGIDDADLYIAIMSKLLHNRVSKNLENIIDRKTVLRYNLDGTHGKLRLKDYKNFYTALIEAIKSLPSEEEKNPELVLRQAMQFCKKKTFRLRARKNHSFKTEEVDPLDC